MKCGQWEEKKKGDVDKSGFRRNSTKDRLARFKRGKGLTERESGRGVLSCAFKTECVEINENPAELFPAAAADSPPVSHSYFQIVFLETLITIRAERLSTNNSQSRDHPYNHCHHKMLCIHGVMECAFLTVIFVSFFAVYSSFSGVQDWEDVVVTREGIPTILICTDTTVRGAVAINWKVQPVGLEKEWKLVLSASEKNEFSGGTTEKSTRLTDPNFQDSGVFSLFLLPRFEDRGLYSCMLKQKERKLKEKIILLAILRVTVVPPPPVPHRSPLRLTARVFPDYAVTQITWTAPSGIIMKSEKKPKSSVLAKLPEVENDDTGAYVCTVYPWGNSSNSLLAFSVNVTVDAKTEISTATKANTPVPLTCPDVKGDYVWLYWLRADAKKHNEMQLVYKYDRWRGSTVNNKSTMLELAGPPYNAEAGASPSFSPLVTKMVASTSVKCSTMKTPSAKGQRSACSKVWIRVRRGWRKARRRRVVRRITTSLSSSKLELGCLYSERSQVISAVWKHQKNSRQLKMSSKQPGSISTYLPLPITSDTAGNYICTIQLEKGQTVSATQAVNLPNEDKKDDTNSVRADHLPTSHPHPAVTSLSSQLQQKAFINKTLSPLRLVVTAGFRSPPSGRMAGWMWLRCVLGPHLQRIHRSTDPSRPEGRAGRRGWNYQPRSLEKHSDSILSWASALWSLSYYSSPLLLCYLYRKGYICSSKLVPVSQYVGTVLVCLLGVACLRGLGRWKNSEYLQFISILDENKDNHTPANKKKLRCYDFDFSYWPSDFSWSEVSNPKLSKAGVSLLKPEPRFLIVHSFGRMLYPGSVGLLQKAMRPMLQQGQARLIEEFDGQRNKLVACDGNEIDTMFVDRRREGGQKGQTLVICCEGNAGFYEVGCMNTPLEVPFPQNEANAMDVVIQYAVHRLGFQLSDIVVYAWSIGGFTVMSYPEIQSVVLDASFDDLLPLALKVMPDSWKPLVQHAVRQYMNLNNADQLLKYQGPVLLIRRTRDEIITTTGPEDVMSNRGNDLLLKLLQFSGYEVDDDWCVSVLQSYQAEGDVLFPWSVGEDMTMEGRRQLALFLARKYMRNFETTHCTPLPASEFHSPWRL
ncbi:hypothetical protein F7725_017994 [Dissostichus mawsoni]|uniref:Ig-like domain-containing protein n=1 Tax=Dissostichus mawsoni TaxID=36200 RepID=A0A7J5XRU6_DISMA|nr:hypothetical protein F7725_017994 [Dissostichus mawsoni]